MPIYETVCIFHPELSEARLKDVIEGLQKTLEESQASLLQVEEWGMRNLAYDIQKQRRGYYVRLEYESLPQAVKDFERGLRLSEDAMRFLSVARSAPSDGQSPIPPGALTDRSVSRPLEADTEPTSAGAANPVVSAAAENSETQATEAPAEAQEGSETQATEAPAEAQEGSETQATEAPAEAQEGSETQATEAPAEAQEGSETQATEAPAEAQEGSETQATEAPAEAQEGDGSETAEATEAQTDSEEKTDEE